MNAQPPKLLHIEYLRAIACTMVVFHHALNFSWPRGGIPDAWKLGAHGVEIFFVISGFVVAWTLHGRPLDPVGFLRRRLLRIVPLYWLALLLVSRRDLWDPTRQADILRDLFFIPHFSAGYPGAIYPALVPGWSLNYEIFFCLTLAAAMVLASRPFLMASALLALMVGVGAVAGPSDDAIAVFYTRPYLLLFATGMGIAAAIRRGWRTDSAPLLWTAGTIGLVAITAPAAGLHAWTVGPAAALLIWAAACLSTRAAGTADRRPMPLLGSIGAASYSVYLFHGWGQSLAVNLMRQALGWPMPETLPQRIVEIVITVVAGLVVGWLAHRMLEQPLARMIRRRRRTATAPMPASSRPAPL